MPRFILISGLLCLMLMIPHVALGAETASTQCKPYQMILKGKNRIFEETMILEKVDRSGGMSGLWKLVQYDRYESFRAPPGFYKKGKERHKLGYGMWMEMAWEASEKGSVSHYSKGKVLFNATEEKLILTYLGTDVVIAKIKGKQVTFNWPIDAQMPFAGPLVGPVNLSIGAKSLKLKVEKPRRGERIVYDAANPGQFKIETKAKVTPYKFADQITWKNSFSETDPQPGPHTVTAAVTVEGCHVEVAVPITIVGLP